MLDYSSGSFTDFILGDQADLAGPGPPIPEPDQPEPDQPVPDVPAAVPSSGDPSLVTGHDVKEVRASSARLTDLPAPARRAA